MLSVYNSILASVRGRIPSQEQSRTNQFSLFSSLPPELRIKIWGFALPSRIIEASLFHDGSNWRCQRSRSRPTYTSCQHLSALFSANAKSRAVCLGASTEVFPDFYIHRSLDILYISWRPSQHGSIIQDRSDSVPIQGKPFSQLDTAAISLERNMDFDDKRFGAIVSCLRDFGTPKRLILCLVGPSLRNLFSDITGFSVSSGKNVVLLDWPNKVEEHLGSSVIGPVTQAFEAEKSANPDFTMPTVDGRLRYITVSNPGRHVPRCPVPVVQ